MASSPRRNPTVALFLGSILMSLACILAPASARLGRSSCHGSHTAFSFHDFSHSLPSLSLLGDAHVKDAGLQVSGSQPQSVGGVFYSLPVRFLQPFRSPNSLSFSSSFSFSMDAQEGDGLAFVIAPRKDFKGVNGPWMGLSPSKGSSEFPPLANTVAIEFDTSVNEEVEDPLGNHVGLDIESLKSLATANVSDSLSLNDGGRLFAWIDYRAPVKVVEVRLSNSERQRPSKAMLSYSVDLSNVWREEMFVGFSSSTGNLPQRHTIHSWSFGTSDPRVPLGWQGPPSTHSRFEPRNWHGGLPGHADWPRDFPGWHHPRPGFPEWHPHPRPEWHPYVPHNDDSWIENMGDVWRIVVALLFGATCGTAVAACMLVVWSFIRRRCMSVDEDYEEAAGIMYGYQKLTTPESDEKVDANGYQKIPSAETEGKTEGM